MNVQRLLSQFDALHDKYQFQDSERKEFLETLGVYDGSTQTSHLGQYTTVVLNTDLTLGAVYDGRPVLNEDKLAFVTEAVNDLLFTDERDEVFWHDVVAILRANTRMEGEHLVWKDNGERVTMEDEEKLLRIVKSTKSAPDDESESEDDDNDDCLSRLFITTADVHGLISCVVYELCVPVYVAAFAKRTCLFDGHTLWMDNAKRVVWTFEDIEKFGEDTIINWDEIKEEWNERRGCFERSQ